MPAAPQRLLPWARQHRHLQRVLRWLDACQILRRADLVRLAWPTPVSRQASAKGLQRWQADGFVVPTTDGTAFTLGALGATKLAEVHGRVAPPPVAPAARMQPGLRCASAFAVALAFDLLAEAGIGSFTWASAPFSGAGPRADGFGRIRYHPVRPRIPQAPQLELLDLAVRAPADGQISTRLILEVDLGSETATQLAARATAWGQVLRQQGPPAHSGCWPAVLWVTTGSWDRAGTIWRVWITHAACPLFLTTTAALTIQGALHPWWGMWRDEHGRPRTLNPYVGQEPVWRAQASPPPHARTLERAIAAWEATRKG